MARKRVVPNGCIIHRVTLEADGAEVGFRCADYSRVPRNPDGTFPLTRGRKGKGTYPTIWLRGVTSVDVNGVSVSGKNASLGFELMPRSAVCWRIGPARNSALDCKLKK